MNKRLFVLGSLALFGMVNGASGAVIYTYMAQPQGGTVTPGTTNTLNLFLEETLTNSSTSFVAGDNGLYDGGVALVEKAGGAGVTVTAATPNSLTEPNGFTGNNQSGLVTSGGGWVTDITNNGDNAAGVGPFSTATVGTTTTKLYLLGTATLMVASNANATFAVESIHDSPTGDGIIAAGSNGNTATFNSDYDLDLGGTANGGVTGANGNGTQFVISTATPEPSGLLFCGLAISGLVLRRRRHPQKA